MNRHTLRPHPHIRWRGRIVSLTTYRAKATILLCLVGACYLGHLAGLTWDAIFGPSLFLMAVSFALQPMLASLAAWVCMEWGWLPTYRPGMYVDGFDGHSGMILRVLPLYIELDDGGHVINARLWVISPSIKPPKEKP